MKLIMLLVGASVAAGAHLVLFIASSIIAWIYFRRFKRLQARAAQQGQEPVDDADEPEQRRQSNAGMGGGDQREQRGHEQRMIAALYELNDILPRGDRSKTGEPTKQRPAGEDNGRVLEEEERAHHTS